MTAQKTAVKETKVHVAKSKAFDQLSPSRPPLEITELQVFCVPRVLSNLYYQVVVRLKTMVTHIGAASADFLFLFVSCNNTAKVLGKREEWNVEI